MHDRVEKFLRAQARETERHAPREASPGKEEGPAGVLAKTRTEETRALELVPEKKIVTEIPVHLTGLPIGVKIGGGKLRQKVRKLKVKSLAKHLIEHIEVNVEDLQLGKSIKVEELNIENMEVLTSPYIPVATVAVPRAVVATEAEGDAGAEPGAETAEPGGETKEGGEASADGGGDAA